VVAVEQHINREMLLKQVVLVVEELIQVLILQEPQEIHPLQLQHKETMEQLDLHLVLITEVVEVEVLQLLVMQVDQVVLVVQEQHLVFQPLL
tara:strand:- start:117 stop:392 length:276 start_codon:yes stop_codon:yes gene_type:complete